MFAVKRFYKLKRKEFEKVDCIALHPGFSSISLGVWVLQTKSDHDFMLFYVSDIIGTLCIGS